MARSNPGDLMVICVDQHAAVMSELESYGHQAQPGAHRTSSELANAVGDPDFAPTRRLRPPSQTAVGRNCPTSDVRSLGRPSPGRPVSWSAC